MFAFGILLQLFFWRTFAGYPFPDSLQWTDGSDTICALNPALPWIESNVNTTMPVLVNTDSDKLKEMTQCAFLYDKNFVILGDTGTNTIVILGKTPTGDVVGGYAHIGTSPGLGQLAVDWFSGNLYWADGDFGWIGMQRLPDTIETTTHNDKFKVVVGTYLDIPSGVAVHPKKRLLFWSDIGSHPKIEVSTLYGGSREMIVFRGLFQPRAIAVDCNNDRLYWVDSIRGTVESSDLNGEGRQILMSTTQGLLYGIDFYEGHILVADKDGKKIHSLSSSTGVATSDPYSVDTPPLCVFMFSDKKQQPLEGLCPGIDCDQICVETTGGARCLCEEGSHIEPDGETCTAEAAISYRSILYTNGSRLCSLEIQILYSHPYVPMEPLCFLDIGNSIDIEHFYLDVEKRQVFFAVGPKIYVQHLNEDTHELVHSASNTITDFLFDWVNEKLIWCEEQTSIIYALDVHDLEILPLTGAEILFNDVDSPISLTIDPHSRRLYWISDGSSKKIGVGNLDDKSTSFLVEGSSLVNPKQVVYDSKTDRLYWTATGRIDSIKPSGSGRKVQTLPTTSSYEAITVFRDFLMWTSTINDVTKLNSQLGDDEDTRISFQLPDTVHVKQIAVFSQQQQPEDPEPCSQNNGGCDQFCIATGSSYSCECDFGYLLQENGQSCVSRALTTDFFMVTDVLSKQIYQIDRSDGSVRTVHKSDDNEPVTAIHNPVDNSIVFSDGSKNLIKSVALSGGEEYILTSTGSTVSRGLSIDSSTGNIYFSTGENIGVMRDGGQDVKTLITGQNDIGAIALFPSKGYMVWSNVGLSPVINKCSMDGSGSIDPIVADDIKWPKDLAIDYEDDTLYWCDPLLDKIEMVDLRVYSRRTVRSAGEKPIALDVDGNFIYFIDSSQRRIMKIDKVTGILAEEVFASTLVGKLDTLYISKTIAGHSVCSNQNGRCSNLCLPKTTVDRTCSCENGIELMDDGRTCRGESTCSASIPNGKVDSTCTRYVSASCGFECNGGYIKASGVNSLTCLSIGLWKEPVDSICMEEKEAPNIALYAGIGCGAFVVLVIIVLGICCWKRKHQSKNGSNRDGTDNPAFSQNSVYTPSATTPTPKHSEESAYDYINHNDSVRYTRYPVGTEYLDLSASQQMARNSTQAAGYELAKDRYLDLTVSQKLTKNQTRADDYELEKDGYLCPSIQKQSQPKTTVDEVFAEIDESAVSFTKNSRPPRRSNDDMRGMPHVDNQHLIPLGDSGRYVRHSHW